MYIYIYSNLLLFTVLIIRGLVGNTQKLITHSFYRYQPIVVIYSREFLLYFYYNFVTYIFSNRFCYMEMYYTERDK